MPAFWPTAQRPLLTPTLARDHLGYLLARHHWRCEKDLDKRVVGIRERLAAKGGDARVSVLKAVVTQASAAIPAMPIYLAILFKVMKARGTHEGCIEQIDRLFREAMYGDKALDEEGRQRVDDLELLPEVQAEVADLWAQIGTENLDELSDFAGYRESFCSFSASKCPVLITTRCRPRNHDCANGELTCRHTMKQCRYRRESDG